MGMLIADLALLVITYMHLQTTIPTYIASFVLQRDVECHRIGHRRLQPLLSWLIRRFSLTLQAQILWGAALFTLSVLTILTHIIQRVSPGNGHHHPGGNAGLAQDSGHCGPTGTSGPTRGLSRCGYRRSILGPYGRAARRQLLLRTCFRPWHVDGMAVLPCCRFVSSRSPAA